MLSDHRSADPARRLTRWQTFVLGAVLVRALALRNGTRTEEPATDRSVPVFGPPFEPGRGPTTAAWREEAITRANELESLATWIAAHLDEPSAADKEMLAYVKEHLIAVRRTAAHEDGRRFFARALSAWRGAAHQRTLSNLDAVEATLLRLAPASYVCGEMPSLLAHVNRFLPKGDPRQARVERLAAEAETHGGTCRARRRRQRPARGQHPASP